MIKNLPIMYRDDDVKEWCAPDIIDAILKVLPGSLVDAYDFGCGRGVYTSALIDAGLPTLGLDNNKAEIEEAGKLVPVSYTDLGEPIEDLYAPADLVISFETAEHIEPDKCDNFINNLVKFTRLWIIFTGSDKPDSPGHVNPQPNEYWREKITESGKFIYRDDISQTVMDSCKEIIGKPNCLRWFQENLQIFERVRK